MAMLISVVLVLLVLGIVFLAKRQTSRGLFFLGLLCAICAGLAYTVYVAKENRRHLEQRQQTIDQQGQKSEGNLIDEHKSHAEQVQGN